MIDDIVRDPQAFAENYMRNPPKGLESGTLIYRQETPVGMSGTLCGYSTEESSYLGADDMINKLIISQILSLWSSNNEIPTLVYNQEDSFTSLDRINYTQTASFIDPLSPFGDYFTLAIPDTDLLEDIINYVVTVLNSLKQDYLFNHGRLTADHIFISFDETSIAIKINGLANASLTLETQTGPVRIYNRSWIADRYLYLKPFKTHVGPEGGFYIIDKDLTVFIYNQADKMGIPFYLSFDIYVFILSLLLIPNYYYAFFGSKSLVEKIWDKMWFPQDKQAVRNAIVPYHKGFDKREELSIIMDIIRGKRLQCRLYF